MAKNVNLEIKYDKMRIIINEKHIPLLKESNKEVTFYSFLTKIKKYLDDLELKPFHAEPDQLFVAHGISKKDLLKAIMDANLMSHSSKIEERMPEGGDKKEAYITKIYKKNLNTNFQEAMEKMYKRFFPDGRLLGEGHLFEAGATACGSVGAIGGPLNSGEGNGYEYDVPLGVQKRSIYKPKKDPTTRRHDGKNGSISIPKRKKS